MEEWKEYKLEEVCTEISDGLHKAPKFKFGGDYIFVNAKNIVNGFIVDNDPKKKSSYEEFLKYASPLNDTTVLFSIDGTIGNIALYRGEKCILGKGACYLNPNPNVLDRIFLYYELQSPRFRGYIDRMSTGSTIKHISLRTMRNYSFTFPSIAKQRQISSILKSLDDKIEVNKRINDNFVNAIIEVMLIWLLISLRNDNLEQQAMAIFDKMFPAIASGEDTIGSMITPKRGKGLLSKDAVEGNVPVVAGGLEPSTYHNESNTIAPVLTISASGANAGYVNLWHIPVWSSDSSFIDATMTSNVYFWYVMLKKRQKEIFDAQTGSAQPHIYPKHIAEMPLGEFEQPDVEKFTEIVTPMFEIRGKNMKESERLASIRDTLLPKLMSGELKLENVNV